MPSPKSRKKPKPRRTTPAKKKGTTGADTAPATKPANRGKSPTLREVADAYLQHMEASGKSPGTVHSYSMELKLACTALGEKAKVKSLTAKQVAEYFESDAVMKTRTGKTKAKPSIDKTRRVLRLALVWAAETGRIPTAPIPQAAASA